MKLTHTLLASALVALLAACSNGAQDAQQPADATAPAATEAASPATAMTPADTTMTPAAASTTAAAAPEGMNWFGGPIWRRRRL